MGDWKTIESAPKDGTPILVFVPFKVIPKTNRHSKQTIKPHMRVVHWATAKNNPMLTPDKHTLELQEKHGGYWSQSQNGFRSTFGAPSHWMALPSPPSSEFHPHPEELCRTDPLDKFEIKDAPPTSKEE